MLVSAQAASAQPAFTLFESGQVRPLALSPNGKLLFAVNTPDNRLEVFKVENTGGLSHRASIPVGLEPVAVAVRDNDEVWVVNHLSDSVSVVKLEGGGKTGRVVRTLLVGDEPRDIVFAGHDRSRAFITTAHRGQNIPFDPQLTTEGIGRADVWVFDAGALGTSLAGNPLTIVTLFTDTPRALAVTPDGTRVYAAGFHSGNRTTVINDVHVPDGFGPDGLPGPSTNVQGIVAPEVGLIVKHDGAHWVDELGRSWDGVVNYSLPDKDVFVINATANPPQQVAGPAGYFTGVGTILFNMVVNPVSGKVYVSNTDARNEKRFEGPGIFAGQTVRGHLHESRITVLSPGSVVPRHLNKHIDYESCCAATPNSESEKSLAQPQEMVVSSNGATLYVAALGSSKVGVFSTAALENDSFVPNGANQIQVSGGGPTGLVLAEAQNRLYVLTRFDNSISVINTATKTEVGHVAMHNPEPSSITAGRRFLYDARTTSSHGDSSCASCHIYGDFDSLAWDLGNPDGLVFNHPGPFAVDLVNVLTGEPIVDPKFHPMKGPMTTQSLRGMENHGSMHWRGDRTGGNDEPSAQPDSGTFDERAAFEKFRDAFPDLLGRSSPLPAADMEALTDFVLQVTYPPNPNRVLDNSISPAEAAARDAYFNRNSDGSGPCNSCHTFDETANPDSPRPGVFGGTGAATFDFETQLFKAPHLRNAYQKVGMFGFPASFLTNPFQNDFLGDQVRGYGFIHDGSFDTVFRFLNAVGFAPFGVNPEPFLLTPEDNQLRRDIESFLLAYPTNMAPIVGQQVTLTRSNGAIVGPRIDLLIARAEAGECDLVVKTSIHNDEAGFFYAGAGQFLGDRECQPSTSDHQLRKLADHPKREVTYTCTPPGSGERIGLDRDGDGYYDGDEADEGSDPADPDSTP